MWVLGLPGALHAQVPPTPAEIGAYQGLHAAAHQGALLQLVEGDQVKPHALQAHFEVDQVDRIEASVGHPALCADRLVVEDHGYIRSVRSTTRASSSSEVTPCATSSR